MAQLNLYQSQTFTHWKGLSKNNHLGAIFAKEPQKATTLMVELLAAHRGKNLESYLSQFPVKMFDTQEHYTWEVIGSSRRNIPILEGRDESGTVQTSGNIGVGGLPFYLVFPEDWFADGNVIVGELNELYPIRILGDAKVEGTNYVYKCELMGGITTGIPASETSTGKRFSVEYSPVEEELSRGVGDVRFSAPISMRNEFSTIRIKHKVPGSMLDKKLATGIPVMTSDGKRMIFNAWMHYVDYQVEETFSDEKNNIIMYGRSNRNRNGEYMNFGKSGNVIKQGAGLREQMEVSNVLYYNTFNIKLIEDALYELSASKLGFSDRKFILKTGERGAAQFHKAVLNTVSGWSALPMSNDAVGMISKTTSNLHTNALSAGYQFVEFKAPNGVIVKVEVDPMYDDPVRNKIMHPNGGVAESYRYDLLYIGSTDQPNIQLAKVKNLNEVRGYMWGLRNPFTGTMNNPNMAYDEDSATIHKMSVLGVFILDPTRTMSIIPSILRG
jgi:hypothetical protein